MQKFDQIYKEILSNIMTNGIEEFNERTGHMVKALPGITLSIDIEKDGFPVLTLRKQPIKSPIAEQIWFLQGEKNTEFLKKYTKIWDLFLEEDGSLPTAYGYRWRQHFKTDQLGKAIELLKKDPSSRHAVVITWDPSDDGFGGTPKKNVPCPYTFTLNIIGKRLHLHNIVRSNDMILGFPFDVFGFAMLQSIIAQELGVKVGVYTHSISNAHIYDNHYEAANEILRRDNNHNRIDLHLPENTLGRAESKDENLISEIFTDLSLQYDPLPAITGLEIAL